MLGPVAVAVAVGRAGPAAEKVAVGGSPQVVQEVEAAWAMAGATAEQEERPPARVATAAIPVTAAATAAAAGSLPSALEAKAMAAAALGHPS